MKTTKHFSHYIISKGSLNSIKGKGPGEDGNDGGPIGVNHPTFKKK